jgi:hypothetical protein
VTRDATPTPAPPFFILRDLDGCWLNASVSEAIYDEFRNQPSTGGCIINAGSD